MIKKKILVVEDNSINRAVLSGILETQYDVLEAQNGYEALTVLKQHPDEISLIMLDIIMPVMDGYTFLSTIKKDPVSALIPVIVTTQNDGESEEVAALSHGASDFVVKPYKPQIILHRVASLIHLRETAAMMNQFKYDRLTGLYSEEFFYHIAQEMVESNPEKQYDIICSDIENFKFVNDVFGVSTGDALLRSVADFYKKMVNGRGVCAHFNADKFMCLMEHQQTYTNESFLKINSEINAATNAKNVVLKWGVYAITDTSVSVRQMCDWALLAARSIKGQYGRYVSYYDDTVRNKLLRDQEITNEMEVALQERQFLVYLQPKCSTTTQTICGAEALVRWNHPVWGFQSPAEFIPLFEKNGFITKLDQYVWNQVAYLLQKWDRQGLPTVSVSVNVSRADIYNIDLAEYLSNLVKTYGLHPSRIHLEVTESAYTEDPEQIIETIGHLRQLGFVIEMDDFGSGYSSLSMLSQLPLDVLKLDMKFVRSEMAKSSEEGILRFIMELAHWMKLGVVAEGVETQEQLQRLDEVGCDYVQGYYLGKPMPAADFEKMLKSCELP